MKKKKLEQFDEREEAIRDRVFMHGFFILAALLLFDHSLELFKVQPFGRPTSLVYLAIAITVVSIEFIIRGVYFGCKDTPKTRLKSTLGMVVVFGFNLGVTCYGLLTVDSFAENGQLTIWGGNIILFSSLTLIGICGFIRAVIDLRRSRRPEE